MLQQLNKIIDFIFELKLYFVENSEKILQHFTDIVAAKLFTSIISLLHYKVV